jgi:glycerol uptake facilitator-like aquaporin
MHLFINYHSSQWYCFICFVGGHISGAHYNPAVTFGVCLRGKMHWKEGLAYVLPVSCFQ